MIYHPRDPSDRIDQGDMINGCPILTIGRFDRQDPANPAAGCTLSRVVVLTQACDLAQGKASRAVVAVCYPAQQVIDDGALKPSEVKGPVRAARVYGWYFLPAHAAYGIPELLVDLRQIHTVEVGVLVELCRDGNRNAGLATPYREHLAKNFAATYSRIGLPEPYQTEQPA
mgnify:CR=1 FL=1